MTILELPMEFIRLRRGSEFLIFQGATIVLVGGLRDILLGGHSGTVDMKERTF